MQQIKGEEYVKGRERTDQPENAFVSDDARGWCLGLEASLCPSGRCAVREVGAATEIVLVLSMEHLCTTAGRHTKRQ